MKINLITVNSFAVFFLLLGAIGWFIPFLGWPFQISIESPNTEPHGIILDSEGNIYCGSKFYGRIQKYYPDGRFVRGYDTEGGTFRGSDFGFHINEKDQLCITVSGILENNKGSGHRTKTYDNKGNLIRTEKRKSIERTYQHHMSNYIVDSSGNRYHFKGFLFPRIVKQSELGKKSIIISTPIWLWFFQAPFPAFALFFISLFVLIFTSFIADAAKISVPVVTLIFGVQRLPNSKKIFLFVVGIIVIIVPLSIMIPVGMKTHPLLVMFGFLSFIIIVVIIMLLATICEILRIWRCAKLDSKTLKKSFNPSAEIIYKARKDLRSLMDKDVVMQRVKKISNKIALSCLLVWFVVLVLTVCVVIW